MKNHNPSGSRLRFASMWQRLLSALLFVTLAALIWAAWSGDYDAQVNRFAAWLQQRWDALLR
jgi:hypothetical protein